MADRTPGDVGVSVLASWSGGAAPTVVGAVSVAPGSVFWGSDALAIGSSAAAAYAQFDFASTTTVALRVYFTTPSAWAASSTVVAGLRTPGYVLALGIAVAGTGAPGQLRITRPAGTVASSAAGLLALDTRYRVEVRYDAAGGDATYAVWAIGGTVPLWEGTTTGITDWQVAINRVDVGRVQSTPTLPTWHAAHIVVESNAAAYIGPHASDTPTDPEPPAGFLVEFDGTYLEGDPPAQVGAGVGSHGRQRLTVAASDPGLWPGPGSLTVDQGNAPAYVQYDLPEAAPVLHVVAWLRIPDAWAASAWGAVTLRPNPGTIAATITISGAAQPGQVRLTSGDGVTVVTSARNTLTAGGLYRFELLYDSTGGRARAAAFLPQTHLPLWDSGWQTAAAYSASVAALQLGRVTTVPEVGALKYGRWYAQSALPAGSATWYGYRSDIEGRPLERMWTGTELVPLGSVAQLWTGTELLPLDV